MLSFFLRAVSWIFGVRVSKPACSEGNEQLLRPPPARLLHCSSNAHIPRRPIPKRAPGFRPTRVRRGDHERNGRTRTDLDIGPATLGATFVPRPCAQNRSRDSFFACDDFARSLKIPPGLIAVRLRPLAEIIADGGITGG